MHPPPNQIQQHKNNNNNNKFGKSVLSSMKTEVYQYTTALFQVYNLIINFHLVL